METLDQYLDFAKDIAKYAGEVMIKYFKQNNGASYKGDKTIVTLADTEIGSPVSMVTPPSAERFVRARARVRGVTLGDRKSVV